MSRQNNIPFKPRVITKGGPAAYTQPPPGRIPQNFKEAMLHIPVKQANKAKNRPPDKTVKTQSAQKPAANSSADKWKSSFKPLDEQDDSLDTSIDNSQRVEIYDPYDPISSDSDHEMLEAPDHKQSPPDQDNNLEHQDPSASTGSRKKRRWASSYAESVSLPHDLSPESRPTESRELSPGQRPPEQQAYSPDSESLTRQDYDSISRPLDHRVCSPDRLIQDSSTQRFPASYGGQRTNGEERIIIPEYRREVSPDYRRAVSPAYKRAVSPEYKRAVSPEYKRAVSPEYKRAVSPEYKRAVSPDYKRAVSPAYKRAVSPDYKRAVSPEYKRAVSPDYKRAVSPEYKRAVSPDYKRAVSPEYKRAVSPPYKRAVSPAYKRAVSPEYRREMTTVRLSPPRLHRDYQHMSEYVGTGRDQIPPSTEGPRNRNRNIIMDKIPVICDLCDVELANGQELEDHLESKSHWDTLEHIQRQNKYDDLVIAFLQEVMLYKSHQYSRAIEDGALQALQENDYMTKIEMFHCAACRVFVSTSASSVHTHITSQEHLANTKEFQVQQRRSCLDKAEILMKELKPQFEDFLKGGSPFQ